MCVWVCTCVQCLIGVFDQSSDHFSFLSFPGLLLEYVAAKEPLTRANKDFSSAFVLELLLKSFLSLASMYRKG